MDRIERRAHRRLDARYNTSYWRVGSAADNVHLGCTANVGSGGLYLETGADPLERGELLRVELAVPSTPGLLEFGGRLAGFARVLRCDIICDGAEGRHSVPAKYGAALQFCRSPKLCL